MKVQWTDKRPTEPGAYLVTYRDSDDFTLETVYRPTGKRSLWAAGVGLRIEDRYWDGCLWAGPIEPPQRKVKT